MLPRVRIPPARRLGGRDTTSHPRRPGNRPTLLRPLFILPATWPTLPEGYTAPRRHNYTASKLPPPQVPQPYVGRAEFLRQSGSAQSAAEVVDLYMVAQRNGVTNYLSSADYRQLVRRLLQLYASTLKPVQGRGTPASRRHLPVETLSNNAETATVVTRESQANTVEGIVEFLLHWVQKRRLDRAAIGDEEVPPADLPFVNDDFNVVIYALARLGRLETAWEFCQRAAVEQIKLQPETLNHLLHQIVHHANQSTRVSSLSSSPAALASEMKGGRHLVRNHRGDLDAAERLYLYCQRQKIRLPTNAYHVLLELAMKHGADQFGTRLCRDLQASGQTLTDLSHALIIRVYAAHHQREQALKHYNWMSQQLLIKPTAASAPHLITALGQLGQFSEAWLIYTSVVRDVQQVDSVGATNTTTTPPPKPGQLATSPPSPQAERPAVPGPTGLTFSHLAAVRAVTQHQRFHLLPRIEAALIAESGGQIAALHHHAVADLMRAHATAGHSDRVCTLYEAVRHRLPTTDDPYQAAILQSLYRVGDTEAALAMYGRLRATNTPMPLFATLSLLDLHLDAGDTAGIVAVLDDARACPEDDLPDALLDKLVRVFSRLQRPALAEHYRQVLNRRDHGLTYRVSVNLIVAYGRSGRLNDAFTVYNRARPVLESGMVERQQQQQTTTATTHQSSSTLMALYSTMVNACLHSREPAKALLVFQQAQDSGLPLSPTLLADMMLVFTRLNHGDQVHALFATYEALDPPARLDNLMRIMHCFELLGDPDRVLAIYARIRDAGLTPTAFGYRSILMALLRGQRTEAIPAILDDLETTPPEFNEHLYCALLEYYDQVHDLEAARQVWKRLSGTSDQADSDVVGLPSASATDRSPAVVVGEETLAFPQPPKRAPTRVSTTATIYGFSTMMRLLAHHDRLDESLALFEQLDTNRRRQLHLDVFHSLLASAGRLGRLDLMVNLLTGPLHESQSATANRETCEIFLKYALRIENNVPQIRHVQRFVRHRWYRVWPEWKVVEADLRREIEAEKKQTLAATLEDGTDQVQHADGVRGFGQDIDLPECPGISHDT